MLSLVAYFEILLQLSLHLCQFTCTLWNFGKKRKLFIVFLKKKRLFSGFLHIKAQLSLKNAWLPPVFFLDFNSIAPDMIYLSHIVIIWEKKYFPLVGTVLNGSKGSSLYSKGSKNLT